MRILGTFAVGVALLSTTALTQAQTVTRQVTRESVETVITQGPNGTAVTRRILTPEPGVTYVAPPPEYPPVAVPAYEPTPAYEQTYVEPVPLAPRRVTAAAPERTRTTRRVTTATRPVTRSTRTETVTRTVAAPPMYDDALVLSPAQRQIIYRAVVPVPPRPVVADVYAPPAVAYPPRAIYPADDDYYRTPDARDYAYDAGYDSGYRTVPYRDPYHPEYRQSVALVVGARVPQSVPLLAVPEPVLARIPAARPYSYARLDGRVYLVDPATGIIAADITP
jgi:hypothetical protein